MGSGHEWHKVFLDDVPAVVCKVCGIDSKSGKHTDCRGAPEETPLVQGALPEPLVTPAVAKKWNEGDHHDLYSDELNERMKAFVATLPDPKKEKDDAEVRRTSVQVPTAPEDDAANPADGAK